MNTLPQQRGDDKMAEQTTEDFRSWLQKEIEAQKKA